MGAHKRNSGRKTNLELVKLVENLYTISAKEKSPVWRDVAMRLEKPIGNRAVINLSRLDRYTKEGDVIVVPGKILGMGRMSKKITVSAYMLSSSAVAKLEKAGCKLYDLQSLARDNPKGSGIKLMA
ncbi:MAG: 50S ribosomal protein L18e [Thermoplasmata archaeon]|nr:50S ribosomal protein L18e [Candidatus Sysuiplasma acidicola]